MELVLDKIVAATTTVICKVQLLLKINKSSFFNHTFLPNAKFQFPAESDFMLKVNTAD